MRWVASIIHRMFPTVRHLGMDELRGMLQSGQKVVIVDVREKDEYSVSHLPGAILLKDGLHANNDSLIVLYCSAGYRSSQAAKTLSRQGFINVWSLDGGIFAWANAGLPLENNAGPPLAVHPHSSFGKLFLTNSKSKRSREL